MSEEKQIEEMAGFVGQAIDHNSFLGDDRMEEINMKGVAEELYNAGYRKQSEGEWIFKGLDEFRKYKVACPFCEAEYIGNYDAYDEPEDFNFCPNCGVKMKGGAE